ncbi:hypothetical protein IFR05_006910 [Cadophora sp. M221]|nr:hypothetical protein IFR05_006910 [Cadophora sp. M221]
MALWGPVLRHERQQVVRNWISHCVHRHPECGNRELASVFADEVGITLIDVKQMCLVESQTSDRYLALSYVWGQTPQYSARIENVVALHKTNSLAEVLSAIPTVIQNAITLTRQLGERLLWVDSLCIIQDHAATKHSQLALMAEIYNSATATIIACAGADASAELFPDTTAIKDLGGPTPGFNRISRIGNDIYPFVYETGIRRPRNTSDFLQTIAKSHYSRRGWTYQERLLSRRRIYFLDNEIIFHCRSDMFPETGDEKVKYVRDFRHMPGSQISSGLTDGFETAVEENRGHGSEWPSGMMNTSWDKGFRFWSSTLEEYSKKEFSFDEDILDACTGVLQAFQGYSGWKILQGMPEPLLDLALLWVPSTAVRRRPSMKTAGTDPTVQFLSWSWLGWYGGVKFPLTGKDDNSRTLVSSIPRFEKYSEVGHCFAGEQIDLRLRSRILDGEPDISFSKRERDSMVDQSTSRFLKFMTSTIPGAQFRVRRENNLGTGSKNANSDLDFRASICMGGEDTCGVFFGLSDTQIDQFSNYANSFELILLSESLQSTKLPLVIPRAIADASKNSSKEPWTVIVEQIQKFHMFIEVPIGAKLLNVMLIETKGDIAERAAIGQISSVAWERANPVQKTVVLG